MDSLVLSSVYSDNIVHYSDHFHDCHQILYVVEGSASVTVSGSVYPASAGTLVLISRFEQHAVRAESGNYRRYNLRIAPEAYGFGAFPGEDLLSVLINRPRNFRHAVDMSGCPQLEPLLQRLTEEAAASEPLRDRMLNLLLFQLLTLVCRRHPSLIADRSDNLRLIADVQQLLETEYASRFTLADLAARFHLSQSHLSHLFRQITGQSVMGYLTTCRLAAAKRLLAETDLAIGAIVERCGFTDSSNFGRLFRSVTGETPTSFRARYRI